MSVIETSRPTLPDPSTLVEEWLDSFHRPNTKTAYRRDIDAWLDWCDANGVQVYSARRKDVNRYLAHLGRRELSNATQCRMVSSVSSFYAYAGEEYEDDAPANPTRVTRPPVGETSMTPYLDAGELSRLLAVADARSTLDSALVRMLAYTGARVSELCGASTGDLQAEMGVLTLLVRRKGGREQRVTIAHQAAGALRRHLGDRVGALFLDDNGDRMRPHQITYRLRLLCEAAGVKRLSPHGLRHTMATLLLRRAKDPQVVQRILGHRRVSTTMRYLRPIDELEDSPVHALAEMVEPDNAMRGVL